MSSEKETSKLIKGLIEKYKWPGINAITFKNGEMVLFDGVYPNAGEHSISPICDSTIHSYLKYNYDDLSDFDVFSETENNDFKVFCGDASYEGQGVIYVLNKKTESLVWFLFFENSGALKKVTIKENVIYALSQENCTWKIPVNEPLEARIV